jgi:crotonobetaine/carnitine-CoA ligase
VTARNTPPYLLSWLALAWLGAASVPTNPAGSPAELAGLLEQVRPRAVVTDAQLRDSLTYDPVLDVADLAAGWDGPVPSGGRGPADVGDGDVAVLLPTSGTTGRSKLVMQTHRAYTMAGEGFPYWMELTRDDRMMTSLPLFHVNALAYSTMGSLTIGAGLILLPRFSASGFLGAARRHGATEFNAIGAMLEILMRQPVRADDADNPLRLCYTGPAPSEARHLEIETRFGLRIVGGYGMSETTYGLIWPRGQRPYGTLGSPRQHPRAGEVNRMKVVDESGAAVAPGEVGELLVSNPAVTPGYWGMPVERAAVLQDGWLRTGDLVTVDPDGIATFVGRRKEVLRRRGENLSPLEVEEALEAHPAVLEAAVVGVPSDLSEEEVKAFVVARAGHETELADFGALRAWAAERLSAFKVPRYWQALPELPRTPTGRVAKHRLPTGHPDGEQDLEARHQPRR